MTETQIVDPNVVLLRAAAQDFLTEFGSHEFANHGDEYTYGEFITIAQMADGAKARNNCYIAACEVLELLGNEAFGGENMRVVAVANEDVYHAALALTVDDNWYVIDFTSRQFDEQLAFPFIATQAAWQQTIDWANDVCTAFCGDASDPSSFE